MPEFTESDYEAYQEDLEILVDALRQSFQSEEARYFVVGHQNALFVELEGLEEYTQDEISEIAQPVLDELDLDFDEVALLPLNH